MACYHPLKAIDFGINEETGKHIIKVLKGKFDPDEVPPVEGAAYIPLPCGRCIGCRLSYSRVWADRCMAEASLYENNIFLTLTYNDDNLPAPNRLSDGSLSPVNPLVKRDLQLFIKRLRKVLPDQRIRYFACGEYSPKLRPHYHLIIFNCKLDDLELLYKNDSQFKYYTSKTISGCWKYGFHNIASSISASMPITISNNMKKQKGENSSIYDKFNYPPEFTIMSRKPGIGKEYFEQHAIDIYYDGAFLSTEDGSMRIYPNKYYDYLFDLEYPELKVVLDDDKKSIIENNNRLRSNLTSLTYSEMLESVEENVKARTKILKRKEM